MPASTAWLESSTVDGRSAETLLERFPFTVGRADFCQLRIDSHRVSREHATIDRDGERFRVLDPGSTNGTYVNGRRIHESELCDGDLLAFADAEYCFRCPAESFREAATLVFGSDTASADNTPASWEVIREVRRLQEQLTQSAVEVYLEPMVDLTTGKKFGFTALQPNSLETSADVQRLLAQSECLLLARLKPIHRAAAVKEVCQLFGPVHLFLPVESFEVGGDEFSGSLEQLGCLTDSEKQLVAEFPASAACNIPYFRKQLEAIRELGISVAYDGFAGGDRQFEQFRDIAPDFIKLSKSATVGISADVGRRRQLETVVRAAAEINCRVIAVDIGTPDEADVCRETGCRFAQGDYFADESSVATRVDRQLVEVHAS